MNDLADRLEAKAALIEMGEKITWGSDVALMREAAVALRGGEGRVKVKPGDLRAFIDDRSDPNAKILKMRKDYVAVLKKQKARTSPPFNRNPAMSDTILTFEYKNHRGEIAARRIKPICIMFNRNPSYGYQPGWFLHGRCLDKDAIRSFALCNIILPDSEAGQFYILEWPRHE